MILHQKKQKNFVFISHHHLNVWAIRNKYVFSCAIAVIKALLEGHSAQLHSHIMDANTSVQEAKLIWLFEKAENAELFSAECTLTWTFNARCRWVWLQQRIMVLMMDPGAVSLCGGLPLCYCCETHSHTQRLLHYIHQSNLLSSTKISPVSEWFIITCEKISITRTSASHL